MLLLEALLEDPEWNDSVNMRHKLNVGVFIPESIFFYLSAILTRPEEQILKCKITNLKISTNRTDYMDKLSMFHPETVYTEENLNSKLNMLTVNNHLLDCI